MRTGHPQRAVWTAICVVAALSNTLVAADAGPNFDVALLTHCWEWVVGYSTESCTQTCAQVNRTCDYDKTGEIDTQQALADALSTSFLLGSATGPGTMATFCNGGVNVWPFATAPAAFAYQTFVPSVNNPTEGVYVVSHYCYFPPNPSAYQGDCDTQYIEVPSQRICSCYNGACPPTFAPTNAPVPDPSAAPSVNPTFVPSAAPSVPPSETPSVAPSLAVTVATTSPSHSQTACYEWVIGYSRDSCTETCGELGRTCAEGQLATINSVQALEEVLSTSTLLSSTTGPGTVATFCDGGVNIWPFATAPAAFAYQTFVPDPNNPAIGIYKISHYCYFPVNPVDLVDGCDVSFVMPPSQRICSCYTGNCPPTVAPTVVPSVAVTTVPDQCFEWVIGYSRDSCTETCGELGRTCAEGQLATINSVQALEEVLSTSTLLSSTTGPGTVATFCDGGVNIWPFATAPAAFAYQTFVPDPNNPAIGIYKISHYCYFPVNPVDLVDGCDVSFVMPPSQRICSCHTGNCPPTAAPTVVPSPAVPQGECLEWVLGYSTESCTTTCSRVSRECRLSQLQTIVTQQAFYNMVASATNLETNSATGPAAAYCNQGINAYTFAPVPAAYSYLLCLPSGDVQQTHCNYPTSLQDLGGDCDSAYVYPPAQRFCPCTLGDCPIEPVCHEWVLGYSTESCTLTCNRVSGVCNEANLASIVTQQAFYDMVAVATVIDASCPTGNNADVFCTQGVNTYQFAQAPAAFSYLTHNANGQGTETYCNYPTSLAGLNADCDVAYLYPPSRRFCSCTMSICTSPEPAPVSEAPSVATTAVPTTFKPSAAPTVSPSADPSAAPTVKPSAAPSVAPTTDPTFSPSADPSTKPSFAPSAGSTVSPSAAPSAAPTVSPSAAPSAAPTVSPSAIPTISPSVAPTTAPSFAPSRAPSREPTLNPTRNPTRAPTRTPSRGPTAKPTRNPTRTPTASPTGCFKFVIGFSEKSCTETCADPEVGTGAVCENNIINTIDTLADFSSMLTSAILLASGGSSPSSVADFCKGGVNTFPFANSPAAFAYQEYVADPTPHFVANNYCYYRPAAQGVSPDTCDTKYLYPPSQRMCACRVPSCVDNGAYPLPNYRRLEGVEEGEEVEDNWEEEEEEDLFVETPLEVVDTEIPIGAVEEKVVEVLTTATVVESVSVPATASFAAVAALQSLLSEVPVQYQIAGAAAVVLALLCALGLYTALRTAKPAPAAVNGPESPVSAPGSPQKTMRATRNSHKREVYIDISET